MVYHSIKGRVKLKYSIEQGCCRLEIQYDSPDVLGFCCKMSPIGSKHNKCIVESKNCTWKKPLVTMHRWRNICSPFYRCHIPESYSKPEAMKMCKHCISANQITLKNDKPTLDYINNHMRRLYIYIIYYI